MVCDCLCAEEHIDVGRSKRLGLQEWMETWQKQVTCYKNIKSHTGLQATKIVYVFIMG